MSKKSGPKAPRRVAWNVNPNRPLTAKAKRTLHRQPRTHYGDPAMRPPDKTTPTVLRRAAMPILYGDQQNGHIVGAASLTKPPKGSDGCTVKGLDYRTPMSPERNGSGDRF